MKGFIKRLADTWIIIGIAVVLFILIEIFFRIYLSFSPLTDPRTGADCYGDADWVAAYYLEFESCNQTRWQPFSYWRVKPFEGEFINVDERGLRKTVTKSHPLSKKDTGIDIFFFGGSTIWGTGVRDAYTIPSLSGNELIRQGFNPEIKNFGEPGYVSSQELISLMTELRNGNIPEIVVFYDGVNDILSSYLAGEAGIPQQEKNRVKEFNTLKEKKKSLRAFLQSLRTLSTVKFLSRQFGSPQGQIAELKNFDPEDLAARTTYLYNENIRIVNALAKEYGFHAFFYWQPTLFSKPYQTEYETLEAQKALQLKPFLDAVNDLLFTDDLVYENIRFFNLSNLFVTTRDPLFIDWSNTGENANILVSQRIVRDILPVIDSLKSGYGR